MKLSKLIILNAIVLGGLLLVYGLKTKKKVDYYQMQINASRKMEEAIAHIKAQRTDLGIAISSYLDPLQTGLIGQDAPIEGYSITTSLGGLEAKRTSTNPNFVSLIIRYLVDIGIKKDDSIAVNFSSSFPALNIATIIALDILDLKSVIQTSIGASSYGANIIEFTYLDMEKSLYEAGIIKRKSDLVSLGGDNDNLDNISLNDDDFINSLYDRYSEYEWIKIKNVKENILYRYNHYQSNLTNIKAFVNVGGNIAGFGLGIKTYPNGLVKRYSTNVSNSSGLIDYFIRDDVPLIHFLNIVDLAKKNQMAINQSVSYELGIGNQYYYYYYNPVIILATIILSFGLIVVQYIITNKEKLLNGVVTYEPKTDWDI